MIIVAIGSSSTAGAGASSPAMAYPSQLQERLGPKYHVINLGIDGEEMPDEIARFNTVLGHVPDLVIWQVGTNEILRHRDLDWTERHLRTGLKKLGGVRVIVVDPQFSPVVTAEPEARDTVAMIARVVREAGAKLYRRFEAMRQWHDGVSNDGLHLDDTGYGRMADSLAAMIKGDNHA